MVYFLIRIIDLDMEPVLSLLSDLKLQMLNVLTIGVTCCAGKSEVGLAINISKMKWLEVK